MSNETPKASKWPDLNEIGGIITKLGKDLKKSVCEITSDYQAKRKEPSKPKSAAPKQKAPSESKPASSEKPKPEAKPSSSESSGGE